jgi:dipeptidyl aminopeptidase/acylaminoacyl peptidase
MRNGRILHAWAGDTYWDGDTAPPPPTGSKVYHWDAFDQDTGWFLYAAEKYWIVGEDGLAAEFQCPVSSGCGGSTCCLGGIESFGPDSEEITVPSQGSADSESAHVIGFDGALRDTLDISAATISPHQTLSDLEWSPDGNRLAVSTDSFATECDASRDQCGGRVWIFDRDGGEPQMVYAERDRKYSALGDLAWSPRGTSLAALVAPATPCGFPVHAPPRVVVLRASPDEPVRAETLIVYDDDGNRDGCILAHHLRLDFPFAWSPDGTRIAVLGRDDITEVSVGNGEILARHEAGGAEGPLAWLPKS